MLILITMKSKKKLGLSKTAIIGIIIVILIIAIAAGIFLTTQHPSTTSTTTTSVSTSVSTKTSTSPTMVTLSPPNTSVLIDDSQIAPPDALDPATGFYVQDGPLFTALFQELVEFNGSNFHQVVPVIAQNYTTTNYENYTFFIRQGVYFPDGVQVNASTVWFSFYRTILIGQGPGVANYIGLLFNSTVYGQTGYAIPWGVNNAIQNATGLPTAKNYTLTALILASILSHFNANNATIQKIMEYPYQAVVVKGPYEVQINVLVAYTNSSFTKASDSYLFIVWLIEFQNIPPYLVGFTPTLQNNVGIEALTTGCNPTYFTIYFNNGNCNLACGGNCPSSGLGGFITYIQNNNVVLEFPLTAPLGTGTSSLEVLFCANTAMLNMPNIGGSTSATLTPPVSGATFYVAIATITVTYQVS